MKTQTPETAVEASQTGTRDPVSPVAPDAALHITEVQLIDFVDDTGFQFRIFGYKDFGGFRVDVFNQYGSDWPYPSWDEAQTTVNHVMTALNAITDPRL